MEERWTSLPRGVQRELGPIAWLPVTGSWNGKVGRFEGVDAKRVWEMITQRLPEWISKVEELLKKPDTKGAAVRLYGVLL